VLARPARSPVLFWFLTENAMQNGTFTSQVSVATVSVVIIPVIASQRTIQNCGKLLFAVSTCLV
jgi:hypothetical protein